MTRSPSVSCIVPVYNGERFLGEALDSALAQPYRPLEIIVVDDGSTDGSARVATTYGSSITYLYQANAGPAAAINHGLRAASGEFLTVLAADDLWPRDRLALQLAHFARRPGLDVSIGHVVNFWVPELGHEAERFGDHRLSRPIAGYTVATMLARREVFEAVGYLDPAQRHTFSTDWFLRVRGAGFDVEMLPETLLHRRMHQENRSRQFAARSQEEYLSMLKRTLDLRRQKAKP